MNGLGLTPDAIARWTDTPPANPARNQLLSLALRPAPVTDQWLEDGPKLADLDSAAADITLVEAPSTRVEALTIAMRLRQAAEDGQAAALITPDRTLTRQVTAALDRWNILPDDSAGMPLHLSAPGRFLRHVGDLFRDKLTAELLLTLLKHPLTHSGADRGAHLRLTRELELHLRRHGPPYPQADDLTAWADTQSDPMAQTWAEWISDCITAKEVSGDLQLAEFVTRHIDLASRIASGPNSVDTGNLWAKDAGQEAWKTVSTLQDHAPHGGRINASDYTNLFYGILSGQEVRSPDTPHPKILIWGTLEARVQGADLLILAGLNEGSWPEAPKPDPWLNRKLRNDVGLLLPERRIGLSAHDFQQAATAPEVWMTRSIRSDDAETVVSRWLNRLENLLKGLPERGGKDALDAMRARGQKWLSLAEQLEDPGQATRAKRPAPIPPAIARPKKLSVTEIKTLIRDPYAIYAKHVLGLRPLDPLMKAPDALLRGTVLHKVLEVFIKDTKDDPNLLTRDHLIAKTETILAENVPWPEVRAMWLARMERVADWILESEETRRGRARPNVFEEKGQAELPRLGFTLSGTADRIDMDDTGRLYIYDYKTGAAPAKDQQKHFDKQLLLEAAMAELQGFGQLAPNPVAGAYYLSLNNDPKEVPAPLEEEPVETIWKEFEVLIATYLDESKSFPSRRAMFTKDMEGDYDQLARFGEWDITDDPEEGPVT